jgi:RluA family pseudouridine synthase
VFSSMKLTPPNIPKKYLPKGFEIMHEDLDLLVVNKQVGILSVAALWEKSKTVHGLLNTYLQKGNARSSKKAFVVHRLDQATSGVLIFARSEKAQQTLKMNWPKTTKTYYTIVEGHLKNKSGLIESFLQEDEDYVVTSTNNEKNGKLARTEYIVVKEIPNFSLLKINLLTGKKNQIRVHMAESGHPIVGDVKYGKKDTRFKTLMLHSFAIEVNHPHTNERARFEAPVPLHMRKMIDYNY